LADDLQFAPDGTLEVVDHPNGSSYDLEVRRFEGVTGEFIVILVPSFPGGSEGFLTIGPDRNLYVSTGDGGNSVVRFDETTGQGVTFVASGSGGLSSAEGLMFNPQLCDSLGSYGPCTDGAATR